MNGLWGGLQDGVALGGPGLLERTHLWCTTCCTNFGGANGVCLRNYTGWQRTIVKTSCWLRFGMFRHPACWAVGSCSSGPLATRSVGTKSMGGFHPNSVSPCSGLCIADFKVSGAFSPSPTALDRAPFCCCAANICPIAFRSLCRLVTDTYCMH